MANQIDNLSLGGAATFTTAGYIQRMHIGQAAADFNVATGLDDLGVKGDAEIVGVLYPYGGINTSGAAQDHTIITGQANAYRIRGTSGGSLYSYLDFDTSNTVLETEVKFQISKTYGITNDAGGAESMRQPEMWNLGALSDADTAGGVLDIVNPLGAAGYLFLFIDVSTAASNACTVDAGVGTTGILHDTAIDGLDVNTAAGEFSSWKDYGTNGVPGIAIGATDYITISKASGAASGLAGNAYAWIIPAS